MTGKVDSLFPEEKKAIEARRKSYGIPSGEDRRALALSGGGIRSATFSLGLLRGLSSLKLLQKFDYLSTVSGGGYAGVFYGGLFAGRDGKPAIIDPQPDTDLLGQPSAQKALAYLRQSGRYLTPGGGRDYIYALAILFRNWLTLTLVVGMAIILGELILIGLRVFLKSCTGFEAKIFFLSPLTLLLIPCFILLCGTGWAYWLTMSNVSRPWMWPWLQRWFRPPLLGTILVLVGAYYLYFGWSLPLDWRWPDDGIDRGALITLALALSGLSFWIAAFWREAAKTNGADDHDCASMEDRTRHLLSKFQLHFALAVLIVALAAAADFATLSFALLQKNLLMTFFSPVMAGGIPAARWLIKQLAVQRPASAANAGAPARPGFLARFGFLLAWIAALLFILAALAFWGGIAHWLAWPDLGRRESWATFSKDDLLLKYPQYCWALFSAAIFVLLASYTQGFVNLSSLATFYAGRLRRAYLGASNPQRIGVVPNGPAGSMMAVNISDPHDDLGLRDYYRETAPGAPVHLINVTINATVGNGPATVQRDRHGLNMVISPDGMSYAGQDPGAPVTKPLGDGQLLQERMLQFRPSTQNPGQSLALSTWIGISGAAFTTGLGAATSLANSVLAFLTNVRLGYWWKADRMQLYSASTYSSLFREMTAAFPGTNGSLWYLSDGGHFENTAVYELIRRRVPLIVISDNGCDPHYGFEDVANLVRKSRIDFGAEIRFLNEQQLDDHIVDLELRALFAAPPQFANSTDAPHAIAMLARIDYCDGTSGTMIVVKPRLTQDGPADLMRYLNDNPDFPQQTTLDQFFDEAQWESYYELGRLLARRLFARRPGSSWSPALLTPIDWAKTPTSNSKGKS